MKQMLLVVGLVRSLHLSYEESEGPTKVDFGEHDPDVLYQEDPDWVNPLSLTDDGSDDDDVLNLNFAPLDEPWLQFRPPAYDLDDDIVDTLESEQEASKLLSKVATNS